MPLNDTYQPTIFPIPDEYTANAIMYGSAYTFQLSSKFYWDQVQDQLEQDIERLKRKLINKEFAAYVMNNAQHMVFANPPPSNNPDEIRDLWTLREIVRKGTALYDLQLRRTENRMWAEMVGVSEYSARLNEKGVSEDQWKAATMGQMVPIEFESIRALRDYEPIEAKKEVDEYLSEESRMKAESARIQREYDDWLAQMDRSMESDEGIEDEVPDTEADVDESADEDGSLTAIPIYREMVAADDADDDSQDDGGEPYRSPMYDSIIGIMRWMAYDPALETIAALAGGD